MSVSDAGFLERKITIGLIVSKEYIAKVRKIWNKDYIQNEPLHYVARWAFKYHRDHKRAPMQDIETILYDAMKNKKCPEEIGQDLEELILPSLSKEYEQDGMFNAEYLYDQTVEYFRERRFEIYSEQLADLVDRGNFDEAEALIKTFNSERNYKEEEIANGGDLLNEKIKPITWLVKDFIPMGLTILGGRSKVGKSYFMLNIVLALAQGNKIFNQFRAGYKPKSGQILYLSLEDPRRRFQSRMKEILKKPDKKSLKNNLNIVFEWEKLVKGGIDQIKLWIEKQDNPKLVVIDTIAKVWNKKSTTAGGGLYAEEYAIFGPLANLAHEYDISIIVVTHTTKNNKTHDPFDQILGGMGTQGPADNLIVLSNAQDRTDRKILSIRGKDMEEKHLSFNASGSYWKHLGDANEVQKTSQRQELFDLLNDVNEPLKVKDIKDIIIDEDLPIKLSSVQTILGKMLNDGQLERPDYGLYTIKGYKQKQTNNIISKNMNNRE